ncbi:MAG: hypothetical protein DCF25_16500 [Leptolyngbya foveolarum]|uniref:Uncharacterized protein n=1 Tax=Leptolyngbya foveolarum TaxID=47253 RepID=A0A2W4U7K7_9CYAN|nr:MAG: hypothetical protein DCF25_16500 [Leptolyngbya foveolarum]
MLTAAVLLLLVLLISLPEKAVGIAPFFGLCSAISAAYRDSQHRQVPKTLSASPALFVEESTAILDSGLAQIKEARSLVFMLIQASESMAQSVQSAQQALRSPMEKEDNAPYLGRGFE